MVRWGLVPYWAKDVSIGSRLINARAETVGRQVADSIFRQLNEGAGSKVAGGNIEEDRFHINHRRISGRTTIVR